MADFSALVSSYLPIQQPQVFVDGIVPYMLFQTRGSLEGAIRFELATAFLGDEPALLVSIVSEAQISPHGTDFIVGTR